MHKCPKFNSCNATFCPLDTDQEERVILPEDNKCTLSKNKRQEIGKELPNRGLTKREIAGLDSWMKRTPESKTEELQKLYLFRVLEQIAPEKKGGI